MSIAPLLWGKGKKLAMKNRIGFIWAVVILGLIGGFLMVGCQSSRSESNTQESIDTLIEPMFTPTITPNRIILIWKQEDDRIVLENETQYWDKYQSGLELPGLYLRSDSVESFGDYLEFFPGGVFSLELDSLYLTGIWNVEGENLILTLDKP